MSYFMKCFLDYSGWGYFHIGKGAGEYGASLQQWWGGLVDCAIHRGNSLMSAASYHICFLWIRNSIWYLSTKATRINTILTCIDVTKLAKFNGFFLFWQPSCFKVRSSSALLNSLSSQERPWLPDAPIPTTWVLGLQALCQRAWLSLGTFNRV